MLLLLMMMMSVTLRLQEGEGGKGCKDAEASAAAAVAAAFLPRTAWWLIVVMQHADCAVAEAGTPAAHAGAWTPHGISMHGWTMFVRLRMAGK